MRHGRLVPRKRFQHRHDCVVAGLVSVQLEGAQSAFCSTIEEQDMVRVETCETAVECGGVCQMSRTATS